MKRPSLSFWIIAASVLVLDQVTKTIARLTWGAAESLPLDRLLAGVVPERLVVGESVPLLKGIVHLTFVRNTGAAFGLLPGFQPVFVATTIVVLITIGAYWRRDAPSAWPIIWGLALVVAGAVGNLIDRVFLGMVTDFLEAAFIDFPVFNVADSAVVIGVGLLSGWLLFGPQPEKRPETDR